MKRGWIGMIGAVLPTLLGAQAGRGPYARIAILRARDGQTVEFEAGYIRHLAWHRQARDPWVWYGWSVWAGERNRWFIYATFGHSASSLDSAVAPADDERDNVLNVTPHVEYMGNALYEFLPALSRGSGDPQPTARLELTTVDLVPLPGAEQAFEAAVGASQSALRGETLWYRMVAGGATPRYLRLRPRPTLAAILDGRKEEAVPDSARHLLMRTTIEILTLRPDMSLGLGSPTP